MGFTIDYAEDVVRLKRLVLEGKVTSAKVRYVLTQYLLFGFFTQEQYDNVLNWLDEYDKGNILPIE